MLRLRDPSKISPEEKLIAFLNSLGINDGGVAMQHHEGEMSGFEVYEDITEEQKAAIIAEYPTFEVVVND